MKMANFDRKKHWEDIYLTKELKDVSWFQPTPETSLDFFKQFNAQKNAKVIDIGGGDSSRYRAISIIHLKYIF